MSQEVKNLKEDVAAGTVYVIFDFTAWTPGGDTTGTGVIRYSNVDNNYHLGLKATVNIDGRTVQYSDDGDYVEVIKPDVTGYTFKDESTYYEDIENTEQSNDSSNNLYVTRALTNEYGDATKTIDVYGKQFIQIVGSIGRSNVYYINKNNQLCRTSLVDLSTQILATDVKDIQIDQNDIIHAYPIGDSFMNNIAMEDNFVKYENIN